VPDVHQSLAEAYREAGMLRDAERSCRRLLELNPDSLWATRAIHDIRRQLN
jgi:hypothetical protein